MPVQPYELPAEWSEKRLEIVVRRLANDLRYGQDASPYLGSGVDFAQSRPYVPGDAVRDIDWRITARTRRPHVKQYETVKAMPVLLMVDTSASMAFQSGASSKQQLAMVVAGALALAAIERLSPVSLLGVGQRPLRSPTSLNRARVFQWLLELRRTEFDEQTQLTEQVDLLGRMLGSRHLVIVLSDLHQPGAVSSIKRLALRHETIVLQLHDPAENGRLGGGFFRGVEAETGETFVAHRRTRWFADATVSPADELKAAGVDYLRLNTDQPFLAPLQCLLAERGGLARNTR